MKILFISALDFKERSIQVIRKTPEAYVENGVDVHYVVARDTSKSGNYYYEDEINPEGLNIYRFYSPLSKIRDKVNNRILSAILTRISRYLIIIKMAKVSSKVIKENNIDVCYGYEIDGVLAANLLKLFGKLKGIKLVSRFQGTIVTDILDKKNYKKAISNWEHFLALKLPSDLCIMTDDGTQGKQLLQRINSKNTKNLKFWPNGVDEQKLNQDTIANLKEKYHCEDKMIILTVCRLVHWKKVERGIESVAKLVHDHNETNIKYFIVGEGNERPKLEKLVKDLKITEYVEFVGAVKNTEVKEFLNIADIFMSTYDLSNVGNPLLEAIRANKIIITLNNGDTKEWIQNGVNGYIYDINEMTTTKIAKTLHMLINNPEKRQEILENIKKTEVEKLWTWKERLDTEVKVVKELK